MTDLSAQAFRTSRNLAQCAGVDDLDALFQSSIATVGMSCSASGMVTGVKAASGNPFFFTNWPIGWAQLYVREGYRDLDPCPRYALSSGKAATWTELMSQLPKGDPGHAVFAAAKAWNFTEGLVVPLRNARGELGLVSIGGDRPVLGPEEVEFLKVIAAAAFDRANALTPACAPDTSMSTFTVRETAVINLLHQGLTDQEIAMAIGVSIVTARSHIENARHKVNARSRTHLTALTVPSYTRA